MSARPHKKTTTTNGQRPHAGRFVLRRPKSQVIAFRILLFGLCALVLSLPVSSTISDPLQSFVRQVAGRYGASAVSIRREALLRHAASDARAIEGMGMDDIESLFGTPGLVRQEGARLSWHYAGQECALDIYFDDAGKTPSYVEYRLKHLDNGARVPTHQACIRALFSVAR